MANYLIVGHGSRNDGTSTGTFVVPPGIKIHFFVKDGEIMGGKGGIMLIKALTNEHPQEEMVRELVIETVESKKTKYGVEYKTIPNYFISPSKANEFSLESGVYKVGNSNIMITIRHVYTIADIICGCARSGVLGHEFYWMSCRRGPATSNSMGNEFKYYIPGSNIAYGAEPKANVTGLKPSEVIRNQRAGIKWFEET